MKCIKCGAEIDDDSNFCEQCGARQVHKRSNAGLLVGIAVAVVVVAGVYLLPIHEHSYYSDENPEPAVVEEVEVAADEEEAVEAVEETTVAALTPIPQTKNVRAVPAGYTDLGLPSGKLWKNQNEPGLFTYEWAINQFSSYIPTKRDWVELRKECKWTWNGSGYKVTGPNGNRISLPAAGSYDCNGSVNGSGESGYYWSSTSEGSGLVWHLGFSSGVVNVYSSSSRCMGYSVRLIQ